MKESTKEWLGIKPADFVLYAAFILLIPMFYIKNSLVDGVLVFIGLVLCLLACRIGMKPHPELGKLNNGIKLVAYPLCVLGFLFLAYLNFTQWNV
jgi:hypothetical protein